MNRLLLLLVIVLLLIAACAVKKQKTTREEKQELHQVESFTDSGLSIDSVSTDNLSLTWRDFEKEIETNIVPEPGETITVKPDGTVEGKIQSVTTKTSSRERDSTLTHEVTSEVSYVDSTRTADKESIDLVLNEESLEERNSHPAAIRIFIGLAIFIILIVIALIIFKKIRSPP